MALWHYYDNLFLNKTGYCVLQHHLFLPYSQNMVVVYKSKGIQTTFLPIIPKMVIRKSYTIEAHILNSIK